MKLLSNSKLTKSIEAEIHSDLSPVGIDAKKTHLIIIEKLMAIEERLAAIEQRIDEKQ